MVVVNPTVAAVVGKEGHEGFRRGCHIDGGGCIGFGGDVSV